MLMVFRNSEEVYSDSDLSVGSLFLVKGHREFRSGAPRRRGPDFMAEKTPHPVARVVCVCLGGGGVLVCVRVFSVRKS